MPNLREVTPPGAARLRCGIGHTYSGTVRRVQHQGHDIDGGAFWYPVSNDYDPSRCIVCELLTWSHDDENTPNGAGASA